MEPETSLRDIRYFDELVYSRYNNGPLYKNRHESSSIGFPRLSLELRTKILELKDKGWSYAKIGEKFNMSKSAISGAIYRHRPD